VSADVPARPGSWQGRLAALCPAQAAAFVLLLFILCAAFAIGGSSQRHAHGAALLPILGALGCGWGLLMLTRRTLKARRGLLLFMAAILLLAGLQLVPLPPAWWQALPGRAVIVEIDAASGAGALWRPLSLAPSLTAYSLLFLLLPCAVMLLAIQLEPVWHRWLLWAVIGLILVSGMLGLVQGDHDGWQAALGYRNGLRFTAAGLFANRNHQGLALAALVPLVWAARRLSPRRSDRAGLGAWPILIWFPSLFILVLANGSRAGFLLFVGAILWLAVVGLNPGRDRLHLPWRTPLAVALAAGAMVAILLVAIEADRSLAYQRLMGADPTADLRASLNQEMRHVIPLYWPFGTGLGTFSAVYAMHEPTELLYTGVMNEAHNDWLDLALTGGLPVMVLCGAGLVWIIACAVRQLARWQAGQPNCPLRSAAMLVILLAAAASLVDYPARAPAMAAVLALSVVWATGPALFASSRRERGRGIRRGVPVSSPALAARELP
jgi:hypothetical protein